MVHKNIGCRSEVFRGKAKRTSGGLKKEDIIRNKYGRYVSKERSEQAKRGSHLGKWLFKKGGKPSNRSATNLLYETIAKEREMERKKVVPGRLYRKESTDSKPNPKKQKLEWVKGPSLIKKTILREKRSRMQKTWAAGLKKRGYKITKVDKPKKSPAKPKKSPAKKSPAKPKKTPRVIKKPEKRAKKKKSPAKPDKSVYLLPEPGSAKKKEKPKPSFVKTGKTVQFK